MMAEKDREGLAAVLSDNAEGILVGVLAVASLAALVVGGFYVAFFRGEPVSGDPASWGQLGDYLGGVLNPVFGFLSVFALLVALVLQTRELKLSRESLRLSREELKLSREEQAKSAEALALQNKVIQKQSFEQTFFSMLRLLEEVVLGCSLTTIRLGGWSSGEGAISRDTVTGRKAMSNHLVSSFNFDTTASTAPPHYPDSVMGCLDSLYSGDPEGHLNRYARTLQTILGYLHDNGESPGGAYAQILRSQLSSSELQLIYFLCFDGKWGKLKELVQLYGLLAFLNPKDTGAGCDYFSYFDRSAFQE